MVERLEVQRAVAARPGEIFAVLSDPRGHVAIQSSGMLMEAAGTLSARWEIPSSCTWTGKRSTTIPRSVRGHGRNRHVRAGPEVAWTIHGQLDLGHVCGYWTSASNRLRHSAYWMATVLCARAVPLPHPSADLAHNCCYLYGSSGGPWPYPTVHFDTRRATGRDSDVENHNDGRQPRWPRWTSAAATVVRWCPYRP